MAASHHEVHRSWQGPSWGRALKTEASLEQVSSSEAPASRHADMAQALSTEECPGSGRLGVRLEDVARREIKAHAQPLRTSTFLHLLLFGLLPHFRTLRCPLPPLSTSLRHSLPITHPPWPTDFGRQDTCRHVLDLSRRLRLRKVDSVALHDRIPENSQSAFSTR